MKSTVTISIKLFGGLLVAMLAFAAQGWDLGSNLNFQDSSVDKPIDRPLRQGVGTPPDRSCRSAPLFG